MVEQQPGSIHNFDRPPVVEVALSVQFDPLPGLRPFQLRALWEERWRADYPTQQEQPVLPPLNVDGMGPRAPRLRIEVTAAPELPATRCWFINARSTNLLQVQADRMVFNWRRADDPASAYPRYASVRAAFERHLRELTEFIAAEGMGVLRPNACEVTYINHLVAGDGWKGPPHLDEALAVWRQPALSGGELPADVALRWRYPIATGAAGEVGDLIVAADPGMLTPSLIDVISLQLIARGRPQGDGRAGVLAFMDIGREWIVRRFVEVTTDNMHEHWGRTS